MYNSFYLQIKRAVKLGERKQRGLQRSDLLPCREILDIAPAQEKPLPGPFCGLCAAGLETKTVTARGGCEAEPLHKPNGHTRACWKLPDLRTSCSVFIGEKTMFPDLATQAWPTAFFRSHRLMYKPSGCACPERRRHKGKQARVHFHVRNSSQEADCRNFALKTPKWRCS